MMLLRRTRRYCAVTLALADVAEDIHSRRKEILLYKTVKLFLGSVLCRRVACISTAF